MTHYPYPLPEPATPSWSRPFMAAVLERTWAPAASILQDHLPLATETVVGCRKLTHSLAVLAAEVPANLVEPLRREGLGMASGSIAEWRTAVIGELLNDHLGTAIEAARAKDYLSTYHFLVGGIQLRARTLEHDTMIADAITAVAGQIGETEQCLAATYPELARNPGSTSPAFVDFAAAVPAPAKSYHPQLLAGVVLELLLAGASDAMLAYSIREIATHASWPSWRALAREIAESATILVPCANSVLAQGDDLPPGARAYLEFGVEGLPMPELPPGTTQSDRNF